MITFDPKLHQLPKDRECFPSKKAYLVYLEDFYGMPIGISHIVSDDETAEKKAEYEKRKSIEYHCLNKTPSVEELTKTQLDVLYILESRSREYYGETKMYNKRIAKVINRSLSTIEKTINVLENFGFISTYSTRYFKDGRFYTDRIIRCKRVWIESQCRVAKDVWKYCRRPEKHISGLFSVKGLQISKQILSKANYTYEDLKSINLNDRDSLKEYKTYAADRYASGEKGYSVLGYEPKGEVEFDWTVELDEEDQREPPHIIGMLINPKIREMFI